MSGVWGLAHCLTEDRHPWIAGCRGANTEDLTLLGTFCAIELNSFDEIKLITFKNIKYL